MSWKKRREQIGLLGIFVLGVGSFLWFQWINRDDAAYFEVARAELVRNEQLRDLLGGTPSFGDYRWVSFSDERATVTFDLSGHAEFRCVRAEVNTARSEDPLVRISVSRRNPKQGSAVQPGHPCFTAEFSRL